MTNNTPSRSLEEVEADLAEAYSLIGRVEEILDPHRGETLVEAARRQELARENADRRWSRAEARAENAEGEIIGLRVSVTFWREKYQNLARQVAEYQVSEHVCPVCGRRNRETICRACELEGSA